jgi:hypothetical protein
MTNPRSLILNLTDHSITVVATIAFLIVLALVLGAVAIAHGRAPAPAPYDRAEAAALFRECLKTHPRTADIVLAQRSPVSTCLSAAVELATTTTSTRSR